jgi:hypothetical protein
MDELQERITQLQGEAGSTGEPEPVEEKAESAPTKKKA